MHVQTEAKSDKAFHYIKLKRQLLIQTTFPKRGITYWRQVVIQWLHTSPVKSAESLAHPVHVKYPSWEYKFDMTESDGNMFNSIFQTRSRERNIPESEKLQNQISLYARNYTRPIWMTRYFLF